jgi:hypothetical protein
MEELLTMLGDQTRPQDIPSSFAAGFNRHDEADLVPAKRTA